MEESEFDGGYEEGYRQCACFWGTEPGSYVKRLTNHMDGFEGKKILDAGCGEGKNAVFLARQGALVDAIDISERAIENGRRLWPETTTIAWQVGDFRNEAVRASRYDVCIAYGLTHCLGGEGEVRRLVEGLQAATVPAGFHVLCTFNSRRQELDAHPGFRPCLLSHETYLALYSSWEILAHSDSDLTETHPHNGIEHTHSMTRILARNPIADS